MDMTGEELIAAPRERVYEALNDVDILKQSIPGCEEIEKTSDTEMTAKVVIKVGPVKAKFSGKVTLSDLNPPEGYTISGQGKGGPAGFAKGGAKVRLEESGSDTILHYEVHAEVGGKLAQIGGRLIDSTAKKLAGQFFTNFSAIVGAPDGGEQAGEAAAPSAQDSSQSQTTGSHGRFIALGVVFVIAVTIAAYLLLGR
ncbi:MAG: carbon monoxide dehydrogenase subunit G [Alphaproteobacteria bacterium]|nr:carbon monoxide dehydrogenase subunit G [Alphaproteobacteria bacterium]